MITGRRTFTRATATAPRRSGSTRWRRSTARSGVAQLRLVLAWAELHQADLLANWRLAPHR
jgi:hypothetical protein